MLAALVFLAASGLPAPPSPLALEDRSSSEEGAVVFTAFIDPTGRVMDCTVEAVAGKVTPSICRRVARERVQPARDADGKPAYGVIREVANFWKAGAPNAGANPVRLEPDLSIMVKPVPGLLTQSRHVPVAVVIDREGRISNCAQAGEGTPANLVKAACAQLKSQWDDTPLEDMGSPRSYVRQLTVAFEPEGARP